MRERKKTEWECEDVCKNQPKCGNCTKNITKRKRMESEGWEGTKKWNWNEREINMYRSGEIGRSMTENKRMSER